MSPPGSPDRHSRLTEIDFLHPFLLSASSAEAEWLGELASYAGRARAYAEAVRADVFDVHAATLDQAVEALHQRLVRGGSILALGDESGVGTVAALGRAVAGSAPKGRAGTRLVPARELIRRGRPGDVAMVFCTGPDIPGLAATVEEARRRELLSIGFLCDRSGLRRQPFDHCFVVRAKAAERVREAHAALVWRLWSRLQGPRLDTTRAARR